MSVQANARLHPRTVDPAQVLFANHGTIVTYHWLCHGGVRFTIAGLRDVTKCRSAEGGGPAVTAAVAAGGTIAAVALALNGGSAAAVFVMVLTAAITLALTLARHQGVRYSLRARVGDSDVEVFTTRDPRRFGQVARAVQRAIEARPRHLA